MLQQDPAWADRLRLALVGQMTSEERAAAQTLVGAGLVELHGPVSREQTATWQRKADLLLVVDHARPWPASNVPGKFYEYLAAEKPILALCGEGMIRRMMESLNAGYHVEPDDSVAMRAMIERIYECHVRGPLLRRTAAADLGHFHRRRLTQKLACCFDRLLPTSGGPSL